MMFLLHDTTGTMTSSFLGVSGVDVAGVFFGLGPDWGNRVCLHLCPQLSTLQVELATLSP
eukprot:5147654-Amphidinium_carterae.1